MEESLDRMLEKFDLTLRLAQNCNSTLKRIKSRGESWHISSVPSDVNEIEPEPEIVDKLKPKPEVDELEPPEVKIILKPM